MHDGGSQPITLAASMISMHFVCSSATMKNMVSVPMSVYTLVIVQHDHASASGDVEGLHIDACVSLHPLLIMN